MKYWLINLHNKYLCWKYPFLLPRKSDGSVLDNYDFEFTENDMLPVGWSKRFGKKMWKELREILLNHRYLYKCIISEIYEVDGKLAINFKEIPEKLIEPLNKWITKYHNLSGKYCYYCGREAHYVGMHFTIPICHRCACDRNLQNKIRRK